MSSVALSQTSSALAADPSTPQAVAVTEGFSTALTLGAALAAASAVLAAFLMRRRRSEQEAEADMSGRLAPVPVHAEHEGS
jgi:hypothetical protein